MKINLDVRNLTQGKYMILILSTQVTCKKIKYTDNHTEAITLAGGYEKEGCICIITRILNNTLGKSNKWSYVKHPCPICDIGNFYRVKKEYWKCDNCDFELDKQEGLNDATTTV